MIMLRSAIDRETREVFFGHLGHEFGGDFPNMFFLARRGENGRGLFSMLTMVMVLGLFCVYAFLQLVQGFRKQGRDRLAGLLGEGGKQSFLFGRQIIRVVSIVLPYQNGHASARNRRSYDKRSNRKLQIGSRVQIFRHSASRNPLHADFLLLHLGEIVGHLQPQPSCRASTERLGQAHGHFRGNAGFTVHQVVERLARHSEHLCACGNREPKRE